MKDAFYFKEFWFKTKSMQFEKKIFFLLIFLLYQLYFLFYNTYAMCVNACIWMSFVKYKLSGYFFFHSWSVAYDTNFKIDPTDFSACIFRLSENCWYRKMIHTYKQLCTWMRKVNMLFIYFTRAVFRSGCYHYH